MLASGYFLGSAFGNDGAATGSSLGTEVDDVVGTLDDIHIVFHHQYRMSESEQAVEGGKKVTDVMEVKSGGGFVEDKQ